MVDVAAPSLPPGYIARRGRSAGRAGARRRPAETRSIEPLGASAICCTRRPSSADQDGRATGVVVATDYLTGELAARSRRMTQAFENYNQLRVLKRPLTGVYLSFFLMVTLLILVGATWMGLYLAKRITRPGADAGRGRARDRRRPPRPAHRAAERRRVRLAGRGVQHDGRRAGDAAGGSSSGRPSSSSASTSRSSGGAATSRRFSSASRPASSRSTRRARHDDQQRGGAAARASTASSSASPRARCSARPISQPLSTLLAGAGRGEAEPAAQEIALARDGQELHLAAVATPLVGDSGAPEGAVLVLDDVTPLIRAQKVAAWREVARRLAHEIKNPLTPIQLSAERLRRHFADAPPARARSSTSAPTTIVGEVESLKGLVDEFSQFARMPAPRTVPTDLRRADRRHAGALRRPLRRRAHRAAVRRRPAARAARPRADPARHHQPGRQRHRGDGPPRPHRGRDAARRAATTSSASIVADNGPGIPPAEREKLFLPYYSTKRRGSGLGLAIVRRIIAEHGGSIDVGDNVPRGTRFTIELPC